MRSVKGVQLNMQRLHDNDNTVYMVKGLFLL